MTGKGEGRGQAAAKIWDIPIRLNHWLIVAGFGGLWYTGETKDLATHKTIGLAMLGLVIFRILWGIFGSSNARFAKFVRGPMAVMAYLRGKGGEGPIQQAGHNPLGGWSVVALLTLLAIQSGVGLIAQDLDGLESGPLSYLVSYETADAAREWHHLGFAVLFFLVQVHVVAILFYLLFKKDNLIGPMVHGRKVIGSGTEAPRLAPIWIAPVCALIAGGTAWWISKGAPMP